MTKSLIALLTLILLCSGLIAQEPAQEPAAPAATPAPTRVVGQAQSQEEFNAWNLIQQAASADERQALAEQFLTTYPESGLTPYVHYTLANICRQANDVENFILHAEKAVAELPELPDVLAYLSFYYAEKGQNPKAIQSAEKALQLLETMKKPDQVSQAEWASRKFELSGEAQYALGRVHLSRATGANGPVAEQNLKEAVEHFENALENAPEHPYAAFRLGEAYTQQENLEKAIEAYGRTVAMGGVIGDYGRSKLQTVYEFLHKNTDGMEAVIEKQKQELQKQIEERQALLKSIADEEAAAATAAPTQPPAGPPTEPPY